MFIIGIAGGSGSGKTTVVRKIIDTLPPSELAVCSLLNLLKDMLTSLSLREVTMK
jgi:uridine kinase